MSCFLMDYCQILFTNNVQPAAFESPLSESKNAHSLPPLHVMELIM